MRDYGELALYVKALNYKSKEDLKKQILTMLQNTTDRLEKNSLETALTTLEQTSEEELKTIKENF